jgi:hypothetical protein
MSLEDRSSPTYVDILTMTRFRKLLIPSLRSWPPLLARCVVEKVIHLILELQFLFVKILWDSPKFCFLGARTDIRERESNLSAGFG